MLIKDLAVDFKYQITSVIFFSTLLLIFGNDFLIIICYIVLDDDKPYYLRGLREYKNDKMFLIDTIKHEQDLYEKMYKELLNFELEEDNQVI